MQTCDRRVLCQNLGKKTWRRSDIFFCVIFFFFFRLILKRKKNITKKNITPYRFFFWSKVPLEQRHKKSEKRRNWVSEFSDFNDFVKLWILQRYSIVNLSIFLKFLKLVSITGCIFGEKFKSFCNVIETCNDKDYCMKSVIGCEKYLIVC